MFIFRIVFSFIHVVLLLLLAGTLLNNYIAPKTFWGFNFLSLGFPFFLILYIIILLFWVINFRKRAIFFLAFLVLLLTPIRRWVNYSTLKNSKSDFKVLTYNTKGIKPELKNVLQSSQADVLMLQENGYDANSKLNLTEYPYSALKYPIISLYSKHPILQEGEILDETSNGHAQYADIDINGKRVRFVNVYLEPFYLTKSMVRPSRDITVNEEKAFTLLHRFIPTFKLHQEQVEKIKKFIDESPYPVIVGGDFNAVPNSYEYYTLGKNMQDGFLEAGKGLGTSFHDYKIPIRIDYLFSSPTIQCTSYQIKREVNLSDHYPVIGNFSWK